MTCRFPRCLLRGVLLRVVRMAVGAGRVSPRQATPFLCWCKEKGERKHLNTILLPRVGRAERSDRGSTPFFGVCAPDLTAASPRRPFAGTDLTPSSGRHANVECRRATVKFDAQTLRKRSPASVGAQRPTQVQQIVLKVLRPFFAPAGCRPPGRTPGLPRTPCPCSMARFQFVNSFTRRRPPTQNRVEFMVEVCLVGPFSLESTHFGTSSLGAALRGESRAESLFSASPGG